MTLQLPKRESHLAKLRRQEGREARSNFLETHDNEERREKGGYKGSLENVIKRR